MERRRGIRVLPSLFVGPVMGPQIESRCWRDMKNLEKIGKILKKIGKNMKNGKNLEKIGKNLEKIGKILEKIGIVV